MNIQQFEDRSEYYDFMCWAYGEDFGSIAQNSCRERWNSRHAKELEIAHDVTLSSVLTEMITLYKKEQANA